MIKNTAIIVIHGIGDQKPGFSKNFSRKLAKHLPDYNINFFEFEWQNLVKYRERALLKNLKGLKWRLTRRFAISYIGDVLAYCRDSHFYRAVHAKFDNTLQDAIDWVGEDGDIYIVAHSLGSVIAYNFIYNFQNQESKGNLIFKAQACLNLDAIKGFISLGSPLYLYSLQSPEDDVSIKLPYWLNIYSPFDVIGYPVKCINTNFASSSIQDKKLILGGILTFWNPLCHIKYFDSNKVSKIIKEVIIKQKM